MPGPNWTADNVTEVTVLGQWTNGRAVNNVFMVQREEDDAEASARDVLNNWQDHPMGFMSNNYTVLGARYRDRNEAAGAVGMIAPDPAKFLTGQSAGASSPPSVAYLFHKLGSLSAGQRSGRIYISGILESFVDEDGVIDSTQRAGVTVVMQDFLDGLAGSGSNQLCVVHFTGPTDITGTVTAVTDISCDNKAATQRRRLRK